MAVRLTRRGRMALAVGLAGVAGGLVGCFGPASGAAGPAPVVRETVVRPDDTLWRIAERELPGVDPFRAIEAIRQLNAIDDYTVHPGQHLRLPPRR